MEIAVIGKQDFILGFQLAGIENTFEITQDPMKIIKEVMKKEDIGIIVLDEESISSLSEHDRFIIERSVRPVAITLSKEAENETLRDMIVKSIGIDLWGKED